MPIRNEAAHLAEAITSLLAQQYRNFEVIVVDNASTDSSPEIVRRLAAGDPRIRYLRNQSDVGAAESFNRTFQRARGEYFMWAAGHDRWSATFIVRCLDVLQRERSVVLCYPLVEGLSATGSSLGVMDDRLDSRGLPPDRRFMLTIQPGHAGAILGVIRSEALRRTGLFRRVPNPDKVVLAELALQGEFAQVPEVLLYRRMRLEEPQSVLRRRCRDIDPARLVWFPLLQMVLALGAAVAGSGLSAADKIMLMLMIVSLHARRLAWTLRSDARAGVSLVVLPAWRASASGSAGT